MLNRLVHRLFDGKRILQTLSPDPKNCFDAKRKKALFTLAVIFVLPTIVLFPSFSKGSTGPESIVYNAPAKDQGAYRDRVIKKLVSSRQFYVLSKQNPFTAKYVFPPNLIKNEIVLNKCATTIAVFFDEGDHLTRWNTFAIFRDSEDIYMMNADGLYVAVPNIG